MIHFRAPDESSGTDAVLVAASIVAKSEGDFSSSNNATKLEFRTGASETATTRLSISSAGNWTQGTAAVGSDGRKYTFGGNIATFRSGTADAYHMTFSNANGQVGIIRTVDSSTAYNTSSDYRLKENVVYDWDATTRLKQLKPARFNFIANADKTVEGFIAHEAAAVVPESVTGEKDALQKWKLSEADSLPDGVSVGDNKLDDDDNTIIEPQGIDQSKLVPLMVKTIQELEARITALEDA